MTTASVRDVGSVKDLNEVGQQRTKSQDANRDYTVKITEIIGAFKSAEKKGALKPAKNNAANSSS